MGAVQKTFSVQLSRTEVRSLVVQITAASIEEANEKALDSAGDFDFTLGTASGCVEYEAQEAL